MPTSSYTRKRIDVTVSIGNGTDGEDGSTDVLLSGLRVSASITNVGGPSMGEADIRIYGLPPTLINRVSTLGLYATRQRNNRVSVSAGDDVSGMSLVYQGTIGEAWADYTGMPETFFSIHGLNGLRAAIKPVSPSSYPGTADCATIMQSLANQMGYGFENNGVIAKLSNPYFPGTARQQADACARHGFFDWYLDNGTLAIWPKGGSRGGTIPLISPETGLVGYPTSASNAGIAIKTLYNPAVHFGSQIMVQSSLQPACGKWFVRSLAHNLESETPDGQWFSSIEAIRTAITPVGNSDALSGSDSPSGGSGQG